MVEKLMYFCEKMENKSKGVVKCPLIFCFFIGKKKLAVVKNLFSQKMKEDGKHDL